MRLLPLLVGLMPLLGACAYRVHLESEPPGARITLPDGEQVTTPSTVMLRYTPVYGPQPIVATAPGYRPLEVNLRRTAMPPLGLSLLTDPLLNPRMVFGSRPRADVRLLMVREHGPAGTWTAEEQLR